MPSYTSPEPVAEAIEVAVWSDVACPWCFIGKRNLDAAVERFTAAHPEAQVDVEYRSFELQPDAPLEYEGTIAEYLAGARGVTEDQVTALLERPRAAGAQAGIEMNFEGLRPARTARAHELLHLAKEKGCQGELSELLLKANFEQGRSLGDPGELLALAVASGLDREKAEQALKSGKYREAVLADREQAAGFGIGGVPFFLFGGRFGISGAQPPEILLQALEQVESREPGDG